MTALRLEVTEIVQAVVAAHREALDLQTDAQLARVKVAVGPREAERLADAGAEVEPQGERHVVGVAEREVLEELDELVVLDAAAWAATAELSEVFAGDFDELRRIGLQEFHWPDGVVEGHFDVAEHAIDRLIGVSVLTLLPDEAVDDLRGERGQAVAAERGLEVQPDVLLAQFQCVVAGIELRALEPDVEKVGEAHVRRVALADAMLIVFIGLDACQLCVFACNKATTFYCLALAVNLSLLEAVAPLRAALAHMDMIQRIAG